MTNSKLLGLLDQESNSRPFAREASTDATWFVTLLSPYFYARTISSRCLSLNILTGHLFCFSLRYYQMLPNYCNGIRQLQIQMALRVKSGLFFVQWQCRFKTLSSAGFF